MSPPETTTLRPAPAWMCAVLWLAAVYNILWAATNVALPTLLFDQIGMPAPVPIEFWTGINALVGVFGVGYGLAATAPFKHWAVVTIGLLSKLIGVSGMGVAVGKSALPVEFGYLSIVNDAVWLIPMALILRGAWRAHHPVSVTTGAAAAIGSEPTPSEAASDYQAAEAAALGSATRGATLHRGHMLSALSLRELADKTPTLIVFLRHLGCPFCRDTLAKLSQQRRSIEARGVAIVLVHMSPPAKAADFFARYGLDQPEPVWHVSDPEGRLYAAFELARGTLGQTIGPRELIRGFKVAIIDRRLFSLPSGDTRRLSGAFLYHRRRVLKAFRARRASDRIDCADVADCPLSAAPAESTSAPRTPGPRPAPGSGR